MIKNKALLAVSICLLLGGCTKISGMFEDDERPPIEGERISVLELQKSLAPDIPDGQEHVIELPKGWKNTSWPQAGGYPNHSMQNIAFSPDNLNRVWSVKIGTGATKALPLTAQPIIAGNKIFTLDTKARVSAFDALSGKKYWRANVRNKDEDEYVIGGGLAFAHDLLYVTNGYDEILAMSPENGEIIWRKSLPAPSRAAPTVIGGRVFVSTIDSRLVALSAKDGMGFWEYTGIGETASLLGAASPAANDDIVVPVFSSGEITALRVENGSVAWSDNLANMRRYSGGLDSLSDIKAMPVLVNNLVVAISFGGKIAAIDERSGTRIWQKEISGSETPWVVGDYLFVISSDNQLVAMGLADGAISWVADLPSYKDEKKKKNPVRWFGPVMADGHLIVTGSHGVIAVISAQNGEVLRMIKTKRSISMPPVLALDTFYLLSDNGTLSAYR